MFWHPRFLKWPGRLAAPFHKPHHFRRTFLKSTFKTVWLLHLFKRHIKTHSNYMAPVYKWPSKIRIISMAECQIPETQGLCLLFLWSQVVVWYIELRESREQNITCQYYWNSRSNLPWVLLASEWRTAPEVTEDPWLDGFSCLAIEWSEHMGLW